MSFRALVSRPLIGRRMFSATAGTRIAVNGESINDSIKHASYAVRGRILDRAMQIQEDIKQGKKYPFAEVIQCNIGNPQALRQKPMTFNRDVLALVLAPHLMELKDVFPADVVERAKQYLQAIPNPGAYSESQGISTVRREVAQFLERRDGYAANPNTIFLTNGASEAVKFVMNLLFRNKHQGFNDGFLVPIPQYPLYSALTTVLNGNLVPYYLDEAKGWSLSVTDLAENLRKANEKGVTVRGLVVINPGNPTGQTLSKQNMQEIVQFCSDNQLVLCADEVYQENIWNSERPFHSFRKVAYEMGFTPESKKLQLASFHSCSKGFLGECGLRGGFMETHGFDADVMSQFVKQASISLCSNTIGQLTTGLMVRPPAQGEPSFAQYEQEKAAILASLKRRALKIVEAFNAMEGVSCNNADGSMYLFPQIRLPAKAVQAAGAVPADEFYCMKMVEETGVVTVPGSGFGQVDGTYHFRTTFLPPEDQIDEVIKRLGDFHKKFLETYK